MNKNYKKIILGIVLVGLVIMGIFAYNIYSILFSSNTNFETETYEVFIPSDADYNTAFLIIADAVKNRDNLHTTAVKKKYNENIKSGRFLIKKGSSNNDIINTVRSQNMPVRVTFNNQERVENLAGRLSEQIEPDSLSLLKAMKDPEFLKENGLDENTALSIYLPNSYETYWNTSAERFRDKMLFYYNQFWTVEKLKKAKKLNLSPSEVYTLASIVQKETAQVDEMPRVAGVYLNRLVRGIKLDADPTVIYAKKKSENDFEQQIKQVLYVHLEIDNPYNTYRYSNLPPGPIVTPDITAINAVLNPEKHNYLYFVADIDNFGYHKFAKTLAQHNRNAAAYRRWIAKNNR
ncbi:endolytic transglycosylase MltG [uncultured Nonlabens sp.]|uniref:endolytic transglycosylase MltG n=1 Tax=uncultured Nonlabens sp. TaxID=859306 RepID=UPI0026252981|nr:endolytic transglycosylase MltG [uncultured Nonlabens sp.]